MAVFEVSRTFPKTLSDLSPVAQDLMSHFRQQGYEVMGDPRATGDWDISLTKGGQFKSVCGLMSALKIQIERRDSSTWARAGVGIFSQQAVPTVISMLFFWPVLITQVWGLIKQSKLDDEAMRVIGESLDRHVASESSTTGVAAGRNRSCAKCGQNLPAKAAFCPECGTKVA